jgi:transposase
MSVPGIGPIISSAVVAAVGNGAGFKQGRDFGAWLGLVPRRPHGPWQDIQRGNKYLRTLFVQAADVVLARRPSAAMRGLWPWIEQASKRLHRNMLAIALANKLARICLGGSRAWPGLSAEDHHPCGMTKARSGSPRGWLHVTPLTSNIRTETE